ncbi:flagellar biosynthesis anti-sigma factor FlgM [Zoogloea sp.]|uniref:flagellar biosynthesis anti-sigma factor FlgM n=1 Tax=Zoogloea sp. TaxID=49181 RepID=UPI0035B45FE0
MKIDNSVKATGNLPSGEARTRSAKETPKAQGASGGSERVELSSLSARLQQAEEAIANTPVVDSAKVDEIKQAMSQGRFKVDTDKVADGLIDSVRQMLTAQQGQASRA